MRIFGRNFCINSAFIAILIISGLLSYSNSFKAPFVFDDYNIIVKHNPHLHIEELSLSSLKEVLAKSHGKHRPISIITLAINYYFCGKDTYGYHVVNVTIHLFAGVFLFFFLSTTLRIPIKGINNNASEIRPILSIPAPVWIAFLSALIWLVHPLQTNSVTYIVQRMASLSAMFYILSMLLYVKGRMIVRAGRLYIGTLLLGGCFLSGLCAVLSKENAATLPIVILIYEWFFLQDLRSINSKRLLAGGMIAFLIFCGMALVFIGGNPMDRILADYNQWNFTLPERVMTEFRVIAFYFSLIFFPHPGRLMVDYDYPISHAFTDPCTTIISALMILILFLTSIYSAKNYRLLSFCLLWFFGNLVIESSIIGIEIIYEHRLYLPSMMICFLAVFLMVNCLKWKTQVIAVLLLVAAGLGFWSYQRNQVWSSDIEFWGDCVLKSPDDGRPLQNLAYSFYQKGEYEQSVKYYQQSLVFGGYSPTYYNMGLALSRMKHHMEAAAAYQKAIALDYDPVKVYSKLARELLLTGEFHEAVKNYRNAVEINPKNSIAQRDFQKVSSFLRQCRTKSVCVKKLCKEYPQTPELQFKLGTLFEKNNQNRQAISCYNKALVMMPESGRELYLLALEHLATCSLKAGEPDRAMYLFQKGARLSPKSHQFYYQMAGLHFYNGNTKEGYKQLRKAVRNGFADLKQLENDTRFDAVRNEGRFKSLKARIILFSQN